MRRHTRLSPGFLLFMLHRTRSGGISPDEFHLHGLTLDGQVGIVQTGQDRVPDGVGQLAVMPFHRGHRRAGDLGVGCVVASDDRHILGDAQALGHGPVHREHAHVIVRADQRVKIETELRFVLGSVRRAHVD